MSSTAADFFGLGSGESWVERRFTAREILTAAAAAMLGGTVGVSLTLIASPIDTPARPVWQAVPATVSKQVETAEDYVPPIARRVARVRIEYPDVGDIYPFAAFDGFPRQLVPLIRRADIENDLCHSSGEDGDAYRGCNRRDGIMSRLSNLGWCGEGSGKRGNIDWSWCADHPLDSERAEPRQPTWSEREIARLAWEVAQIEQPCAVSNATQARAPLESGCVEAGFRNEDARLNAAYVKLMSAMAPAARVRTRESQREWLRKRELGAAECAHHVAPGEASLEVALIRCRTGMTVPRRRDLELVFPIADQIWDGHPDRDWHRHLDEAPTDKSIEDLEFEYREWELRNTEKRAQRIIDSVPSAGAKATAIALYYGRGYDAAATAESRAALANAIARVATAVESDRAR